MLLVHFYLPEDVGGGPSAEIKKFLQMTMHCLFTPRLFKKCWFSALYRDSECEIDNNNINKIEKLFNFNFQPQSRDSIKY